jgi:hypothetical protein
MKNSVKSVIKEESSCREESEQSQTMTGSSAGLPIRKEEKWVADITSSVAEATVR